MCHPDAAHPFAFAGFPEDNIFHGREIAERVHVRWGTFALVEATRALMRAALEDPLNQKFVLLSEAGIPLYPPDTFYMQLMSETKSRINSCVIPGVSGPAVEFRSRSCEGACSNTMRSSFGITKLIGQAWSLSAG